METRWKLISNPKTLRTHFRVATYYCQTCGVVSALDDDLPENCPVCLILETLAIKNRLYE